MSSRSPHPPAGTADPVVTAIVQEALAGSSDKVQGGRTLPPAAYVSQEFFELEKERIFKREWLCVGHVSQVPAVGDFFTLDLLGEPLIIVRGKDRIRALSSICRHRWAPVAQGSGNATAFSCPFHKWTYALDGSLIGAPLMEQAENFDKKSCRLPEFRSEIVGELGLIFVTFAEDIPPVSERLASLVKRVREEGWEIQDQVVVNSLHQVNDYNWKVQVETYMECYHHIGAHQNTLQKLLPAASTWCEEEDHWCVCHVRLTENVDSLSDEEKLAFDSFAPGARGGETVGHIVVAYPFTLLTFMVGGCDIRILDPVGPAVTRSVILATRRQSQTEQSGFSDWLREFNATADIINKEDNDINALQQAGVASTRAQSGRFSHLEGCAWNLSQYVRGMLRRG